jgi:hypothetical protein
VTDGSERDKQCDVDRVLPASGEDLWRVLFEGTTLAVVRRHTVEAFGKRSDPTLPDERAQRTEGNEGFYVVGMGGFLVPCEIIGVEPIRRDGGFTRPDLLAVADPILARNRIGEWARGRDDRDTRLGEGFLEVRKGNGRMVCPAVGPSVALCCIVLTGTIDVGDEAAVRNRRIGHQAAS